MSASDKVRIIHLLALKGYWIAQTRDEERLCWQIMLKTTVLLT